VATALGAEIALPEGAETAGPLGAARLAAVAAGAPLATLTEPRAIRAGIAPDPGLAGVLADRKARFDALLG
jgi:xylulokinase